MKIEDVKLWAINPGQIGCIVASQAGGYCHTLCNSWGNMRTTEQRPKRICRTCRKVLKEPTTVKAEK